MVGRSGAATRLAGLLLAGWTLWQVETGHFAGTAHDFMRWQPRGTFDSEAVCRARARAEVTAAHAAMPQPGDSVGNNLRVLASVILHDGYTVCARHPRAFLLTTRFECHRADFDPRS